MTMGHEIDTAKVGALLRSLDKRLDQVIEFLSDKIDGDPKAGAAFSCVMATKSFLTLDAEEIETGLCCCRHVPDMDDDPCQRCNDTGISVLVRAVGEQARPAKEG